MNDITTLQSDQPAGLRESLIELLFDALSDPDQAVRTGALRLLVRLPLPDSSWYRLDEVMYQQLELYRQPEAGEGAKFAFDELLEAVVRIPLASLRHSLYEFLGPDQPEGMRQQVAWTLVRARDREGISFLESVLGDKNAPNRQEAAFRLAHYDHLYPIDEFMQLALKDPDPIVRFWLSIAMLRQGEFSPIIQLITQFLEDKFELPILYGNPFGLAEDILGCGDTPQEFTDLLLFIQSAGAAPEPAGLPDTGKLGKRLRKNPQNLNLLSPVVNVLIDEPGLRPAPQADTAEQPAVPVIPWQGNLHELVNESMPGNPIEEEILLQLNASQRTTLVSIWLDAFERFIPDEGTGESHYYHGLANAVVQLPGWFWQGFTPDLSQLFDIYMRLHPDRSDLLEQVAWVVSRAGIAGLLEEYLPLLPLLETSGKLILLRLLERAVFYTTKYYGPLYGAGPTAAEETPTIRHFIDYKSAAVGGEEEVPATLTEGEAARYVQAEVYDNSNADDPQKLERAFLAGREQLLKVWIGEMQAGAIVAPIPVDLGMLPDLESWDLQVYFWEPNHAPAVQIGKLTVYQDTSPDLPVSTCEFRFTPHPDPANFKGRLAVVYEKNVLQMLYLEGKVVDAPDSAAENEQIKFQWAEVKGLGNLDQLQAFDLVFYNESDPEQGPGLMFFGGQAGLKQVSGLDEGIKNLITTLKEAADPSKKVALKAKRETLIVLANLGSMLYNTISEQIGSGNEALLQLRNVQRLQLVSAVRDVFPLELVYVYPPPAMDAELCPNAEQALQIGACFTCEALDEQQAGSVICPMGFLGLRCTIERHAIVPLQKSDTILGGKDYLLRTGLTAGGKTISPFKFSLGGASGKVNAANRTKFSSSMQTLFPNSFVFAENWAEWKNNINEKSLLVMIPHTLKDRGIPALEIGNTTLWQTAVKSAVAMGTKPVVLLIGCETVVPDVPYQSFAAEFARAGAAIIVMTISPIHESHAVPITEILVNQMRQAAQMQQTFSEALLQARRAAMAAGYAEVLTLVADGDADWILVEEG